MTKLLNLKKHITSLAEIENILNAMKNLSLMETIKVNKYSAPLTKNLENIQNVAEDFLYFHENIKTQLVLPEPKLYILLGSERGFCGNFNELIVRYWQKIFTDNQETDAKIIAIGNKLTTKMSAMPILAKIEGANVVEEISSVVLTLMTEIERINAELNQIASLENWAIIYNEETSGGIHSTIFKPLADFGKGTMQNFSVEPLLYVKPDIFLNELLNQYLFTILQQIFYQSFNAENKQRLKHMDAALDWLKEKNSSLGLKLNQFRQEEITEEIEVVMLSAGAVLQEDEKLS